MDVYCVPYSVCLTMDVCRVPYSVSLIMVGCHAPYSVKLAMDVSCAIYCEFGYGCVSFAI